MTLGCGLCMVLCCCLCTVLCCCMCVCVWFCVVACVWCCVVAWCVVHPASFDSWEDILFMEEILQQKTMVDIP